MPITFHCESCKKKIQAPDGAGGKYSSCPYCKHRVYIPMPEAEAGDELRLAPIDEEEEKRRQQLMRETYSLQKTLLKQKETPENADLASSTGMDERELLKNIVAGLKQMSAGDNPQKAIDVAYVNKKKALAILDRLAMSDMPEPELANVPPGTLAKTIRAFRSKLQQ